MTDFIHLSLPPDNLSKFWDEVSNCYSNRSETPRAETQVLYDTFDWRLYKKGKTLVRKGYAFFLAEVGSLAPSFKTVVPRKKLPRFWWDFPEGLLRDRLQLLIDLRALMPLLTIRLSRLTLSILNKDDKTVLKIHRDEVRFEDDRQHAKTVHAVALQPVLGYSQDLKKFQKFLQERNVRLGGESLYLTVLKTAGLKPGGYSSKFRIVLDPDLSSTQALRAILRYLTEVLKSNETGVKSDIDTEFLHDFRVACRRIRSALGQIKGIFPEEVTERFRKDFSILGKRMNRLRDIDVYLLKKEKYRSLLPEELCGALDPFFYDLTVEREAELKKAAKFLDSKSHKTAYSRWKKFIDSEATYPLDKAENASQPIGDLAKRFIFKRYEIVLRSGMKIRDESPDAELHRLRIQCKKLRYLIEFFSSLFPKKRIEFLVGQLKKLQDNLGEYNDLFVQQSHLQDYLDSLEKASDVSPRTAAAIGGLIAGLYQRQKAVRLKFRQQFEEFNSRENLAVFVKLFQPPSKSGRGS